MQTSLLEFSDDLQIASAAQYAGESSRTIAVFLRDGEVTEKQQRFLRRAVDMLKSLSDAASNLAEGTYTPSLPLTLITLRAATRPEQAEDQGETSTEEYKELAERFERLAQACEYPIGKRSNEELSQDYLDKARSDLEALRDHFLRASQRRRQRGWVS